MTKHYVGEVGTAIVVDCGQSLAGATLVELKVEKPDGTLVTWTAEVFTQDGVPNFLKHNLVVDDFDQSGKYKIQAHVQFGNISPVYDGLGETAQFMVMDDFA